MSKLTQEQFAKMSFLVDKKETKAWGFYGQLSDTWDNLPDIEKQEYMEEAATYLDLPEDEWIDFAYYGVTVDMVG